MTVMKKQLFLYLLKLDMFWNSLVFPHFLQQIINKSKAIIIIITQHLKAAKAVPRYAQRSSNLQYH